MKTKIKLNYLFSNTLVLFFCTVIFFSGCKKENDFSHNSKVSSANTSQAKTDGIISVQTGILPPVTPKSFITTGQTSTAEFQIASSKHIFIDRIIFKAEGSLIQLVDIGSGPFPNMFGSITFDGFGVYVDAGGGISLPATIYYNKVDSTTSGQRTQLSLYYISYRTDDNVYHDFYPEHAGKANVICVVNNLPNMIFQKPSGDTLKAGYKQIAEVKLSGDTAWTLHKLPVTLSSLVGAVITNAPLIVRGGSGKVIHTTSEPVQLNGGGSAQTVISFDSGFTHLPGRAQILKIFAPVSGFNSVISTTLSSVSLLVWADGLGVIINGAKNNVFFKQATGVSIYP